MERFQLSLEGAKKSIKIADHMLTQTYPLINDPKILLSVMENVFSSLNGAISAVLYHDRLYKRIPAFPDIFESKYDIFKARCTRRYNLNMDYLGLVREVSTILKEHKKSPVEFSRRDTFVICSDNYRMKTITVEDMKRHIALTKSFIRDVEDMVSKTERILRER